MVKSWDRVFQKLFTTAKPAIKSGHPHRFRDTFAVTCFFKCGVGPSVRESVDTFLSWLRHNTPNDVAHVVGHQQCTFAVDRHSDWTAHRLAILPHETSQYIDGLP